MVIQEDEAVAFACRLEYGHEPPCSDTGIEDRGGAIVTVWRMTWIAEHREPKEE